MMGVRECLIEGRASAKALRWKLAEAKIEGQWETGERCSLTRLERSKEFGIYSK